MLPSNSVFLLAGLGYAAAREYKLNCNPGGNFALEDWNLQLPELDNGHFKLVRSEDLKGCDGYHDEKYFFTDSVTGAMVLKAPGNPDMTGCTTTPNSHHCRTELREVNPDSGRNMDWSSGDTNLLNATIAVVKADDGSFGTSVAQVFAEGAPLSALYVSQHGVITLDIKPRSPGEHRRVVTVGEVPLGSRFNFTISYSNHVLRLWLNGVESDEVGVRLTPAGICSFKLGNYNQGKSGGESEVHVFEIGLEHRPNDSLEVKEPCIAIDGAELGDGSRGWRRGSFMGDHDQ
ncbi:hypothetical protein CDD80_1149 [Ophiocordyceps camponoti-rufipedis]|uniref:Alginate lyase 2 domain-containing protein n=1 Tax=Ophiocordyceps camponoti-rufipedis TaxID=2004952 RepID=A0A2C5XMQ7_9HYPO|nr:hypothetical protein CDD80_1149 [Ophiocordyceps camponoti-rufipedis]